MSNPTLNLSKNVADPDLIDILAQTKREVFLDFNCHALGTIQSFNPSNTDVNGKMLPPTVTVTLNYTYTVMKTNSAGVEDQVQIDYPELLDVPVIILGGGASALTFPITKGDQCLVLFHDRDIDNWYAGATSGPTATGRAHDIADGIALVGLRTPTNFDLNHAKISNGNAEVGIATAKVRIANSTTTLNPLLQNILTNLQNLASAIEAITVTCASPGSPSTPPLNSSSFATIASNLSSIASQIGGLLE